MTADLTEHIHIEEMLFFTRRKENRNRYCCEYCLDFDWLSLDNYFCMFINRGWREDGEKNPKRHRTYRNWFVCIVIVDEKKNARKNSWESIDRFRQPVIRQLGWKIWPVSVGNADKQSSVLSTKQTTIAITGMMTMEIFERGLDGLLFRTWTRSNWGKNSK